MIEYRTVLGTATEPDGTLNGMVTPFGVETVIGDMKRGGFKEEIAPGTFTKTLRERPVVLIHNHDTAMPMASTAVPDGEEGHLSLTPKPAGLMARALPFDTTYANDVRKTSKILGMSFGFEVTKDDWFDSEGRASNSSVGTKRVIREVKLHEVSTTAFPAYGSTLGTVSARDSINAARGIAQERAAKATYADIETCGECGATEQYGAFCSGCGEAMRSSKPSGDFCTSCGSSLDGERDSHVCAESRSDLYCEKCGEFVDDMSRDAHACKESRTVSAEVDATLDAAFKEISSIDRNALPAEVNQFIDLASAALKLASGDLEDEGIPDPDNPNGNDYEEKSQEPDSETRDLAPEEEYRELFEAYFERTRNLVL